MTLIRNIIKKHIGIFDFQKRCCHYLIIQKNRKANHNLYEYIGHRKNIKSRTCGRIDYSIRFCKYNKCKVCKKKGYIESNCLMKVKTTQIIEKFIEEKRNNKETILIPFSSPKQQKQDQSNPWKKNLIEELINWNQKIDKIIKVIVSTSKTELSAKEKLNEKIQKWEKNNPYLIEKICKNCKKTNASYKINGNYYYYDNLCQKIFYKK